LTGAGSVIGCSAKRQQESPSGLDVSKYQDKHTPRCQSYYFSLKRLFFLPNGLILG